jgi:predicted ATPase
VDELITRGVLREVDGSWRLEAEVRTLSRYIPDSVRHLRAQQCERLTEGERHVLEAASVAGLEFSAAAVAAAVETDVVQVETWCEALVCGQLFLRLQAEYPGPERRHAARYRFRHALYRAVVYEGLPLARRRQLQLRVRAWNAATYGERGPASAAHLAVQSERGAELSPGPALLPYAKLTG